MTKPLRSKSQRTADATAAGGPALRAAALKALGERWLASGLASTDETGVLYATTKDPTIRPIRKWRMAPNKRPFAGVDATNAGIPAYFNWVDALRGAAALAVVVHHYHHFYLRDYAARAEIPDASTFPYAFALGFLYQYGAMAVELFWVISGFVFAHVYFARPTSFRKFWVARFARLYPLHLATLLVVAAMQALNWQLLGTWQIYGANDLRHLGLQIVMASNWTTLSRGLSFNGPIWSVSLELVAYGMFFVSLPLLRRGRLLAASGLCALCVMLAQGDWFDPPLLRASAFVCAGYFFFGTCIYLMFSAIRAKSLVLCGALTLAAGAMMFDLQAPAIASVSAALIVAAAMLDMRGLEGSEGGAAILARLGEMSYSLYLVHVPLQIALLTAIDLAAPGERGFADAWWLLPAYLVTTCIVAAYVHRHLEVTAGQALRRLGMPRRPQPPTSPSVAPNAK